MQCDTNFYAIIKFEVLKVFDKRKIKMTLSTFYV